MSRIATVERTNLKGYIMPPKNPYAPSYLEAVRDRLGELAAMPGNWLRNAIPQGAGATILDPNARPTAPAEAMPASIDPMQRQALIEAIRQRAAGGQQQAPVDQRQLILQEAARRGIPVPPDSPLLQQAPQGQVTPDNPAGIQF